jgi:integral membrane sensor domain MASE1
MKLKWLTPLAQLLAVAVGYSLAAKLGLSLAFINASVSPVWPATGVAIAAVWLLGYRVAPGIFLGALFVNLLGRSLPVSTGIAAGSTLEALAAVYLLRHYVGTCNPFSRAGDFVKFVLLGPIISTTFSATIGNLSLCLGGAEAWGSFGALWITWWLGDGVGALLVVPLVLSWFTTPAKEISPRRLVEEGLVYSLNALVCLAVYSELFIPRTASYPIGHLTIPLLLWAALRFGPRGASTRSR